MKSAAAERWRPRRALAWSLRALCVVAPLAAAVGAMVAASAVVPRPHGAAPLVGWLAVLLAVSWLTSWAAGRALQRVLPLAALLELSLTFPERAPSRLRMAQRVASSSTMLAELLVAPPDESTQQAAERILALVTALARHDRRTRGHAERVRAYTDLIAQRMNVSVRDRDALRWAALLHDIGKLHVPQALLEKPGRPTADEWELLRRHPREGAELAAPLLDWLGTMGEVIVQHHERWDGRGYPAGLAGEQIGLGARIVSVADTFEVMTAARSYKRPVRREAALRELVRHAGTQFDPDAVRALVAVPTSRLMGAMGPAAWLATVPFVGQSTVTIAGATTQLTAAATASVAIAVPVAAVAMPAPPAAVVADAAAVSTAPVRAATGSGPASPGLETAGGAVHAAAAAPRAARSAVVVPRAAASPGPAAVSPATGRSAAGSSGRSTASASTPHSAGSAVGSPGVGVPTTAPTPAGTSTPSKAPKPSTPAKAKPAKAKPSKPSKPAGPSRPAPPVKASSPAKATPTKAAPPTKSVPPAPPTKAAPPPPTKAAPPPPTKANAPAPQAPPPPAPVPAPPVKATAPAPPVKATPPAPPAKKTAARRTRG